MNSMRTPSSPGACRRRGRRAPRRDDLVEARRRPTRDGSAGSGAAGHAHRRLDTSFVRRCSRAPRSRRRAPSRAPPSTAHRDARAEGHDRGRRRPRQPISKTMRGSRSTASPCPPDACTWSMMHRGCKKCPRSRRCGRRSRPQKKRGASSSRARKLEPWSPPPPVDERRARVLGDAALRCVAAAPATCSRRWTGRGRDHAAWIAFADLDPWSKTRRSSELRSPRYKSRCMARGAPVSHAGKHTAHARDAAQVPSTTPLGLADRNRRRVCGSRVTRLSLSFSRPRLGRRGPPQLVGWMSIAGPAGWRTQVQAVGRALVGPRAHREEAHRVAVEVHQVLRHALRARHLDARRRHHHAAARGRRVSSTGPSEVRSRAGRPREVDALRRGLPHRAGGGAAHVGRRPRCSTSRRTQCSASARLWPHARAAAQRHRSAWAHEHRRVAGTAQRVRLGDARLGLRGDRQQRESSDTLASFLRAAT